MFLKVLFFIAFTSLEIGFAHEPGQSAQFIHRHDGHAHPVLVSGHHHKHSIDYHAHPKYKYGYKVEFHHTGDHKSHHEHRDGDKVKGHYELTQPDGTVRHTEYHADKHSGFHANMKYSIHHIVLHHHKHHEKKDEASLIV